MDWLTCSHLTARSSNSSNRTHLLKMAMLDMPTVTTGLAPESPPVPRFCKSKVKRNNTVESGSQESATTASPESSAGTFFMYSSSDDERSEPDVHTGLPKGLLRAPPGLSNVSNLATWHHIKRTLKVEKARTKCNPAWPCTACDQPRHKLR